MRLTVKRNHVVLAHRIELDILHDHHLLILLFKFGREQDLFRVLPVPLREKTHRFGDPFGSFEQSLAGSVLTQQLQNRLIMSGQCGHFFRAEKLLFFVIGLHRNEFNTSGHNLVHAGHTDHATAEKCRQPGAECAGPAKIGINPLNCYSPDSSAVPYPFRPVNRNIRRDISSLIDRSIRIYTYPKIGVTPYFHVRREQ